VYALVIGTLVEKRIKWKEIYELVWRSMKVTSIVMSIIIFSAGFGILVAQEQLAPKAATWLAANIHEKWLMLFILNIVFFLIAAVMDEIAIMVIFGPLLIAIAKSFGIDPIHFGSIIVTNVSIGMAAPPIGYCLFVGMAISGLKLGEVAKVMWPFIWVMLIVLMIVTYVPQFSLILI
jgi:C4-dicarboxylate transporter DctM subunit